ncbi:glutaredoxin 3 [Neisseria sp. ZJ106]|uniref:Glutaredoxin n=1 Tax=Neisseria lisongii TaxID=2912188 RepID=A0AAW5AHR3_9NEIS|nr:glutaredoxin 3 [Neisseria lisongii]MCF7521546.1 glutaredoxin 3 [Neisseria lisongii]MCF7529166.1 glutaredoxin 3 [Neisseria lisongii]WCL71027.1 glutaredoxin 3 [Neisseria lisongii]
MNPVTMYTGAFCPYCTMAKRLLAAAGVGEIQEIRVDQNPAAFDEMQQRSGQRSIPQIFIGDTHVGGFTDLYALQQRGELSVLLNSQP